MAEGLQPTFDINGNNGYGWGSGVGAFAGAALGSMFFNGGWGGWGNRGNNGCCNTGCCNNGNEYIMDTLTTMRSDINSISRDQLMQSAANASANCQGFSGINTAIRDVGAANALAQCRTEAAVLQMGNQTQLQAKDNTFAIVSSQKDCCCETQRLIEREGCAIRQAIHAEGEATRALITSNEMQALRDRNNVLEGQLAAVTNQQFATNLAAQTQRDTLSAVQAMLANRTVTNTTTTGTTGAPASA